MPTPGELQVANIAAASQIKPETNCPANPPKKAERISR
jgi:hypothetical protein